MRRSRRRWAPGSARSRSAPAGLKQRNKALSRRRKWFTAMRLTDFQTMARATLIGFSAVAMWALLALLTDASADVPPFLLAALTFAIGTGVGLAIRLVSPPTQQARIPWQVW